MDDKIKIEGYNEEELKTWEYIRSAKNQQLHLHEPIWIYGWNRTIGTGLYDKPMNIEDISIPHWRIMPIDGKAPDDLFFERLSKGIFNVNLYLRKWGEREYLPTRCRWHDSFGHLPFLYNEQYSRILRMMGMAGVMIQSIFKDEPWVKPVWMEYLARLYWYTIEFGLIESNDTRNPIKALGAGIISSPGETRHAITSPEGMAKYKPFNMAVVIGTDYVVDDFQTNYFVLESLDQLESSVMKFIHELTSNKFV